MYKHDINIIGQDNRYSCWIYSKTGDVVDTAPKLYELISGDNFVNLVAYYDDGISYDNIEDQGRVYWQATKEIDIDFVQGISKDYQPAGNESDEYHWYSFVFSGEQTYYTELSFEWFVSSDGEIIPNDWLKDATITDTVTEVNTEKLYKHILKTKIYYPKNADTPELIADQQTMIFTKRSTPYTKEDSMELIQDIKNSYFIPKYLGLDYYLSGTVDGYLPGNIETSDGCRLMYCSEVEGEGAPIDYNNLKAAYVKGYGQILKYVDTNNVLQFCHIEDFLLFVWGINSMGEDSEYSEFIVEYSDEVLEGNWTPEDSEIGE